MKRSESTPIAIIGAGASGLMAAIAASGTRPRSVLLLEKNDRVGRKLLSTGNGRCNLLNTQANACHYHGSGKRTALDLLACMPPNQVLERFESIGLVCREEKEGRVYPLSGQASSVLDTLRAACERLGVDTRCGTQVSTLENKKNKFILQTASGDTILADRVIISSGGKAAPNLGADGVSYALLSSLGHFIQSPTPALAPLKLPPEKIRGLKGIRAQVRLTLQVQNQVVQKDCGEILFTEYGVSGIAAMQLSRRVGHTISKGKDCRLHIHLMDEAFARKQAALRLSLFAGQSMESFFTGMLSTRIGLCLLREAGIPPTAPLDKVHVDKLLPLLWDFCLPVLGTLPFQHAQVTAGGASLDEFDSHTLASLRVPGLYACGEALDVDGDCGGYNLLWAWVSGIVAGESAAQSLLEERE